MLHPPPPDELAGYVEEQQAVNAQVLEGALQAKGPGEIPASIVRRARREGRGNFPAIELHPDSQDLLIAGSPDVRARRHPNPAATAVVVHVHGGGWVFGSPEETDRQLARLAAYSGTEIISIDYRLAPEDPFPAARDDTGTAIEWALQEAASRDLSKVVLMGESSGAHLALSAVLELGPAELVARGLTGLSLAFGIYDLGLSASAREWGDPFLGLSTPWLQWFIDQFTPNLSAEARRDPRYSPAFASTTDLADLPPVLLVVGDEDPVLDDSTDLADRLMVAEVPVWCTVYPSAPHGFIGMPTAMGRRGWRQIADWIATMAAD